MISGITSAKLKLARAAKHLRAIKKCLAIYAASQPHKIVTKAKGKRKVNIPRPPPREISILAGEMVYQMRSALDHLAFELVKLNPKVVTIAPRWFEQCEFPLKVRFPHGCTRPLPPNLFSKELPGISIAAFTFIESVQPYYRDSATSNCLRFLAELSNADKHRYLNLIGPRVEKSETIQWASGFRTKSSQALDRGAEVDVASILNLRGDRPLRVHRRFRAFVNFDERRILGDAVTLPVDHLLGRILKEVKTAIIPAFEQFIKNP